MSPVDCKSVAVAFVAGAGVALIEVVLAGGRRVVGASTAAGSRKRAAVASTVNINVSRRRRRGRGRAVLEDLQVVLGGG